LHFIRLTERPSQAIERPEFQWLDLSDVRNLGRNRFKRGLGARSTRSLMLFSRRTA
jgi:hypothetical protein